jgi:hypothetical protein
MSVFGDNRPNQSNFAFGAMIGCKRNPFGLRKFCFFLGDNMAHNPFASLSNFLHLSRNLSLLFNNLLLAV